MSERQRYEGLTVAGEHFLIAQESAAVLTQRGAGGAQGGLFSCFALLLTLPPPLLVLKTAKTPTHFKT